MSSKKKSVLNVLRRLIAYPFCIGLIILGVRMLCDNSAEDLKGPGLSAIVIASAYLVMDVVIIMKRRRMNKRDSEPD